MKNLAVIFLLLVLCSCRTVKQTDTLYIERTDTIERMRLRVDSIHVKDSVVTFLKGDTIFKEKWHTAYRDRLRVDTVERIKTDTVYQTRTETELKEVNRLYWWQKALMWIGAVAGFLILIIAGLKAKKLFS